KLDQLYQQHYRDLTKQMDALHQMEEVSKTANSESAKITMTVAVKRLEEALAQRARIRGQLEETARQTMLRKAHDEEGRRTAGGQTADPEPSGQLAGLSLPLLGRQRAFLDEELAETEKVIGKEAEHIQGLGGFSSQVAAKQQELRATKAITNELREELNRIGVEQLSAERITKLDDAVLASNRGDAARKNIVCAVLAIVGLAVIVGGFSLRHRVPGHAAGQEG
ncbi:MAG TPA: hypothetical protein VHV08_17315, partial [Pirellulales bacterium]|nr:hypothetical protein [Pirellulales bacterium]